MENRKYYDYNDVVKFVSKELKSKNSFDIWDSKILTIRKGGNVIAKKGKGEGSK